MCNKKWGNAKELGDYLKKKHIKKLFFLNLRAHERKLHFSRVEIQNQLIRAYRFRISDQTVRNGFKEH